MQQDPHILARTIPAKPLQPQELVTNATLRDLAIGGPERAMGELSPEHVAQLVMILPDICGELLAWRAAARLDPVIPFPNPRNHHEEIANLRGTGL